MPIKQEVTSNLHGQWKVELFKAPCEVPWQCLYGCLCTPCAAYQQREELLDFTGEPYVCCAGLCACGPLGEPMDRGCLCIEACCCAGMALSGNRFMIQTRFDRENTPCDDCIITFTTCFYCAVEIAKCFVDVPDGLELLADCLVMSVNGCMHAQQHIELAEIKKNTATYAGPPAAVLQYLPDSYKRNCNMQGAAGAACAPRQQQMGRPYHAEVPSMAQAPPMQQHMPQQHSRPRQQSAPQPQRMSPPQMGQTTCVQVACGGCGQVFGSPNYGVTVACPFCGTHNAIPAPGYAQGVAMPPGGQYREEGQGRRNNGMAMGAAGGAAGAIGAMMVADALF